MPSTAVVTIAFLSATVRVARALATPGHIETRGLPAKRGKRIGFIVGMAILGLVLASVLCGCIILFCAACSFHRCEPDIDEFPQDVEVPKPSEGQHIREATAEQEGPPPYVGGTEQPSVSAHQETRTNDSEHAREGKDDSESAHTQQDRDSDESGRRRFSRVSVDPPRIDLQFGEGGHSGWMV